MIEACRNEVKRQVSKVGFTEAKPVSEEPEIINPQTRYPALLAKIKIFTMLKLSAQLLQTEKELIEFRSTYNEQQYQV